MSMQGYRNKLLASACLLLSLSCTVTLSTGCEHDNEEDFYGKRVCDTNSVTYSALEGRLEQQCFGCHMAAAPSGNVAIYDYNSLTSYINISKSTLLGSLNHTTASPMPKGGQKWDECEIKKVEAWINHGMQP